MTVTGRTGLAGLCTAAPEAADVSSGPSGLFWGDGDGLLRTGSSNGPAPPAGVSSSESSRSEREALVWLVVDVPEPMRAMGFELGLGPGVSDGRWSRIELRFDGEAGAGAVAGREVSAGGGLVIALLDNGWLVLFLLPPSALSDTAGSMVRKPELKS